MLTRKKVLLAKIEGTYATDSTPTGSSNAILVANLVATPFEAEQVQRETVQPYLGARGIFHVGQRVRLEFDVEMAGAGTAGDAPGYGPLLRACGFAETLNASTSAVYDPVSESFESVTMHFHQDGSKHALVGCRGNVDCRMTVKQIPVFHFTMVGLYVAPAAATDPTPTLSAFQTPLSVSNDNTPTFSLHSHSGKLMSVNLDTGNQVVHRELVGEESVRITDRQASGQIVIEAPALGTKNFFTAAAAETQAALQVVHGGTAGNIVQLDAPKVQLLSPQYTDSDGVVMLQMGMALVPDSGDDELSITIK